MAFDKSALAEQLVQEASLFDIELSSQQVDLLLKHLALVIEKNQSLNLTRIVDEQDAVTKHLVDSLLFLPCYQASMTVKGRFLDLGTGAAFPGIPFGIMTNLKGTLLDSVAKKVAAVSEFSQRLGMLGRVDAVSARVEDFARDHQGAYACVLARAVAEQNVLIEYASPLLCKDGLLISSKGHLTDEELENATYAARVCGMKLVSRETFELPREAGHRELCVYRKVKKPAIALPRKVGQAKHKPLVAR